MTAEQIVRALADNGAVLMNESGCILECGLCHATARDGARPGVEHEPDCEWRLAVEWVAAQDERERCKLCGSRDCGCVLGRAEDAPRPVPMPAYGEADGIGRDSAPATAIADRVQTQAVADGIRIALGIARELERDPERDGMSLSDFVRWFERNVVSLLPRRRQAG